MSEFSENLKGLKFMKNAKKNDDENKKISIAKSLYSNHVFEFGGHSKNAETNK